MVIHNSKNYLEKLTPLKIDKTKFKDSLNESKNKMVARFEEFEKYLQNCMSSIKDSINAVYIKMLEQIELKTGSND